jgi:NADPH:quinone reductase-like Zn-dependent oxidoreductase
MRSLTVVVVLVALALVVRASDKKVVDVVRDTVGRDTEVLPLTDAVKAMQQAETHHTRGKLVLKIAEEPKS